MTHLCRQVEQWPSQSGFNTVGLNSTVAEFTAAVVTGQVGDCAVVVAVLCVTL